MRQSFPIAPNNDGMAAADFLDFSTLLKEHADRGFNFAYRLTGNEQNARDLVQQTFTNAFKHFGRYERSRPFAPWFNQILKNLFLDGIRKLKHRRTMSLDGPSPIEDVGWDQLIPGPDRTPLEQMEETEMSELLQKALNLLPLPYRKAVTLCDVDRFSYQRISEILKCPVGTIRSRIHQGRILLRESFQRVIATPAESENIFS